MHHFNEIEWYIVAAARWPKGAWDPAIFSGLIMQCNNKMFLGTDVSWQDYSENAKLLPISRKIAENYGAYPLRDYHHAQPCCRYLTVRRVVGGFRCFVNDFAVGVVSPAQK